VAAPTSPSARYSTMSTTTQAAKSKKKPSFLGTLFAKEPSADAFLQMQQQTRKQIAQNPGRKNHPGMSGVSSVKIPQHVPKVNSKWDGMPRRSKEDGERTHSRSDSSSRTSSTRSRSVEPERGQRGPRPLSGSTTSSRHANRTSSAKRPHQQHRHVDFDEVVPTAETVLSSNCASRPRPKSIPIRPQSLRTSSGSSLPQITSFFPNDIPEPPGVPQIYGAQAESQGSAQSSTEDCGSKEIPKVEEPAFESLSIHVSSPSLTPLEQSPITPLSESTSMQQLGQSVVNIDDSSSFPVSDLKMNEVALRSLGSDVLDPLTATRKVSKESLRAFLAGEAQPLRLSDEDQRPRTPKSILKRDSKWQVFGPGVRIQQDLEKRPDSSRSRLGLKASIIKTDDAFPWEWDEEKDQRSDNLNRLGSPKTLRPRSLGIFGKS
jgi:hypothetical protein